MANANLSTRVNRSKEPPLDKPLINFYTAAQRFGFAKDNFFKVKNFTTLPNGRNSDIKLIIDNYLSPEGTLLYAKSGTMPSRKINTTKVNYKNFSFNVPVGASYPSSLNWTLTFYSDENYLIRSLFEQWSQQIYNEHGFKTKTTIETDITLELYKPVQLTPDSIITRFNNVFRKSTTGGKPSPVETKPVLSEIKDNRKKQDRADIFNLQPVKQFKLYGCFPTMVGEITFDVTSSGRIVSLPITFGFQYMETSDSHLLNVSPA